MSCGAPDAAIDDIAKLPNAIASIHDAGRHLHTDLFAIFATECCWRRVAGSAGLTFIGQPPCCLATRLHRLSEAVTTVAVRDRRNACSSTLPVACITFRERGIVRD